MFSVAYKKEFKWYLARIAANKGMNLPSLAYKSHIFPTEKITAYLKHGISFDDNMKRWIANALEMEVDEVFNEEYERERIEAQERHKARDAKYRSKLSPRVKLKDAISNSGDSLSGFAKKINMDRHRLRHIVIDGIKITDDEKALIADALNSIPDELF